MKPAQKGPGVDWPISGWPRHGPLVLVFIVVLAALVLVLLFANRPAGDGAIGDPGPAVPPIESE